MTITPYVIVVVVLFLLLIVLLNVATRSQLNALAAGREQLPPTVLSEACGNAPVELVEEILPKLSPYTRTDFPFRAEDRLVSDYSIDIEDLVDLFVEVCEKHGVDLRDNHEELFSADPTLKEFVMACSKTIKR